MSLPEHLSPLLTGSLTPLWQLDPHRTILRNKLFAFRYLYIELARAEVNTEVCNNMK